MFLEIGITRDEAKLLRKLLAEHREGCSLYNKLGQLLSFPVYKDKDGKWWLMDETWLQSYGPYESKDACIKAMREKYGKCHGG